LLYTFSLFYIHFVYRYRGNQNERTYKNLTDAVFEFETKKLFLPAPEKVRIKRKRSASTPGRPTGVLD
jgi:hypothetical protein